MEKLVWRACNGVKPDLPEGTKVSILVPSRNKYTWYSRLVSSSGFTCWNTVLCYALEPIDPVQELVDAVKEIDMVHIGYSMRERLIAAIKAVEDINDEWHDIRNSSC